LSAWEKGLLADPFQMSAPQFRMEGLSPGRYRISVSVMRDIFPGEDGGREVSIAEGETVSVEFK
jgi:hypothetical protein